MHLGFYESGFVRVLSQDEIAKLNLLEKITGAQGEWESPSNRGVTMPSDSSLNEQVLNRVGLPVDRFRVFYRVLSARVAYEYIRVVKREKLPPEMLVHLVRQGYWSSELSDIKHVLCVCANWRSSLSFAPQVLEREGIRGTEALLRKYGFIEEWFLAWFERGMPLEQVTREPLARHLPSYTYKEVPKEFLPQVSCQTCIHYQGDTERKPNSACKGTCSVYVVGGIPKGERETYSFLSCTHYMPRYGTTVKTMPWDIYRYTYSLPMDISLTEYETLLLSHPEVNLQRRLTKEAILSTKGEELTSLLREKAAKVNMSEYLQDFKLREVPVYFSRRVRKQNEVPSLVETYKGYRESDDLYKG
jgi:hypothetical protein